MMFSGVYQERAFSVSFQSVTLLTGESYNCGVYAISGNSTNISFDSSLYLGSSKNPYNRTNRHFSELNNDNHFNCHFQNFYNKYPNENYTVLLLEPTEIKARKEREQNWLDFYNFNFPNHKPLFNILKTVDLVNDDEMRKKQQEKQSKDWIITDPEGQEFQVKNLKKFADERGLHGGHLAEVAMGVFSYSQGYKCRYAEDKEQPYKSKRPNGWKITSEKLSKEFIVQFPDGHEELIKGLYKFCENHDLSPGTLRSVAQGICEQHKGFKCRYPTDTEFRYKKKPRKKSTKLTNVKKFTITLPDSNEIQIENLKGYCRENGLHYETMLGVAKGKQISTKGYKCRFLGETEFRFKSIRKKLLEKVMIIDPDGKEYIVNNVSKFARENNLNPNGLSAVLKGTQTHHKGYKIKRIEIIASI